MQILYYRAMWGMDQPTPEANLRKIKEGGFDGVEMAAPADPGIRREMRSMLDELGLDLVIQLHTAGSTSEEHAASFEELYCRAVEMRPRIVNAQTGKDYYSTADNAAVFRRAQVLESEMGVPVMHETHRGRATFSLPATRALIEAVPGLRLTADFSHWCCVHESLLQDQAESMDLAIRHTWHIHSRVGFQEGPQVNDPRAPEWREVVETHLGWWQRVIDHHRSLETPVLTVTPEFGPPGYMPALPFTRQPVANLWEVNAYMRDLLKERLRLSGEA